jgi:hypothetical protein
MDTAVPIVVCMYKDAPRVYIIDESISSKVPYEYNILAHDPGSDEYRFKLKFVIDPDNDNIAETGSLTIMPTRGPEQANPETYACTKIVIKWIPCANAVSRSVTPRNDENDDAQSTPSYRRNSAAFGGGHSKKKSTTASSKPDWTSTGRKVTCKDGVKRTLFRRSTNGELRVRRVSHNAKTGASVTRYVKA